MSKIVIFAEKPDIGSRLAATLGGCYIDGTELKPEMLSDKKYEGLIKRKRFKDGYLKAKLGKKDCVITWGFGHIAELKQAQDYDLKYKSWREDYFPFIPNEFEIKVKKDENIKKHFNLIKELFNDKDTEYIINATDAEREGELIFDYAYRLSNSKKPYKRLWINSYTEKAIFDGFNNLKSIEDTISLRDAGRCRAIADWLVGANFTVISTLKFGGYKNIVSVGRVQTPTLTILVDRELQIIDFKPSNYYEIEGTFKVDKETYKGKWKGKETDRIHSKEEAERLVKKLGGKEGQVIKSEGTKSSEKPPLLYDLTALQMDCNSKFSFTAKDTLDIVQKLYENQLLTYPRTNSRYLSEDMKSEIPSILKAVPDDYKVFKDILLSKKLTYSNRYFNDKKVDSHYAIIPTYKVAKDLSDKEQKVYNLVVESLIKAFMPDALWFNSKIETLVEGELFYSSGKALLEKGWRAVEKYTKKDEFLPRLDKGQKVLSREIKLLTKQTKSPPRHSERTLLSAMETAGKLVEDEELREAMKKRGIGTSSTRAAIIEKLIKVGYVKRDKKVLIPTAKGMELIKNLPIEDIKSPKLTGDWEYKLNQIEEGEITAESFIEEISSYVEMTSKKLKKERKKEIVDASDSLGVCPNCGSQIVKNKKGYGCNNWRSGCKVQFWSPLCGKNLTKTNVKHLLEKGQTNIIKGFKSKRTGKDFDAKLELVNKETGELKFVFK